MKQTEIKALLEELTAQYNIPAFIAKDPIQFPRRFNRKEDIEISAVLTSVLAWGKRSLVLRDAERLHARMEHQPYFFLMNKEWEAFKDSRKNVHRTIFEEDIWFICRGLHAFYSTHSSLEELFTNDIQGGIDALARLLNCRHLVSPYKKSPCKRTNMMLRWLVRNDGIVDMGVWKTVSPASLIIPLDVHVSRISRLIWDDLPKGDTIRTACEITKHLAELCSEDPCKYDFALFGFGEEHGKKVTSL